MTRAHADGVYCPLKYSITEKIANTPGLMPPNYRQLCANLNRATTPEGKVALLAPYVEYVNGMDDPAKYFGYGKIKNVTANELCAMRMAIRALQYAQLSKSAKSVDEKALFGSISMATIGILNHFSSYVSTANGFITKRNLNNFHDERLVDFVAFKPICESGKFLFLDFLIRANLLNKCGPGALAGVNISKVINSTLGAERYPISSDTPECKEVSTARALNKSDNPWELQTVRCEQSILQNSMYMFSSNVVFVAVTNTFLTWNDVKIPLVVKSETSNIKFLSLLEYWENANNKFAGRRVFANPNYRVPWLLDIVSKVKDIAKDPALDFIGAIYAVEKQASLYLRKGNTQQCESRIESIKIYASSTNRDSSSRGGGEVSSRSKVQVDTGR